MSGGIVIFGGSIAREVVAQEQRKRALAIDARQINYHPSPTGNRKSRRLHEVMMRKKAKKNVKQ